MSARPKRARRGCAWPSAVLLGPAIAIAADGPRPSDAVLGTEPVAAYAVQVDGRIARERAGALPRQPASLAKLALALVAGEWIVRSPGAAARPVVISRRAAAAPPARLGLHAGERASASDLLAAMLVSSANDACLALAEHVGGSAEAAVTRMNALAGRLGMRDTRFADPCGFDRPGQQTTAYDLLKLANHALADPSIRRLAGETSIPIAVTTPAGTTRTLVAETSNALLGRVEGVTGLKTGYTRQAGRSLIAVARQGGHEVVVVVLGARDRFHAAERLIGHGFTSIDPAARPSPGAEPSSDDL